MTNKFECLDAAIIINRIPYGDNSHSNKAWDVSHKSGRITSGIYQEWVI